MLCDSNTMLQPETLMHLVRHFEERNVGCVCGELRLVDRDQKRGSESLYWKYETMLKFLESRLNMLVGANGGIFAIADSAPDPEQQALLRQRMRLIEKEVLRLPDLQRACMQLKSQGLHFHEIAQALDIPMTAAVDCVRRAVKRLRERLND